MPIYGHTFFSHNSAIFDQSSCNFVWLLKGPLSIDYTSKIAPRSLLKKCTHFGRKMGVATTAAAYGFWATNPIKKLAHCVYLLGQPLSRNRVFQNFSGEPPPLKISPTKLALPSFLSKVGMLGTLAYQDF